MVIKRHKGRNLEMTEKPAASDFLTEKDNNSPSASGTSKMATMEDIQKGEGAEGAQGPSTGPGDENAGSDNECRCEQEIDLDFGKKRKPGRRRNVEKEFEASSSEACGEELYTYEELLQRLHQCLAADQPEEDPSKLRLPTPQVLKAGSYVTAFVNFMEIAERVDRPAQHLVSFLLAELGATGSVNGKKWLAIRGRFKQPVFDGLVRKYLKSYVLCYACTGHSTTLRRDGRVTFMHCDQCGAANAVPAIQTGYRARTRFT